MINQYTNPSSTKGNIKKSFSINALSFNVAFDLCFAKKICPFYQEVLLSRLSSIGFFEKILKQWFPTECT